MVFMKTTSFLLMSSLLSVLSIAREAAAVELVGDWKQCGGNGYTGPTTCAGSSVCTEQNEWYHQCVPSTTLTGAPTTTTRPANCPTLSCNAPCATGWYQVTTLPGASCASCLCLPVTSTSTTVPTTAVVPTGGSNCPIFSCNAPCATGWYQVTTLPGASCGSCLCLPVTSANAAEATPVKAAAEMVITPAPAA